MIPAAFLLALSAHAGDHLQLDVGDQLVFDSTFGGEITLEVDASPGGWRHWTRFPGTGDLWVWPSQGQRERAWSGDVATGGYQLLVDLDAAVGNSWPVALDVCSSQATLAARGLSVTTAAGTFGEVVRVDFTGSCADAGLQSVWFAPEVGPVRWTESNIAGVMQHDLIRGQVGGVVYPGPPPVFVSGGASTTEAWIDMMPGPSVPPVSRISAALTLRNDSTTDMAFLFTSGQQFDIQILDASGTAVSAWSRGMGFTDNVYTLTVPPGEELSYGGQVELTDDAGAPLAPGGYTVRIVMTTATATATDHTIGSRPVSIETPLRIDHAF